jgi:hypothetical protein
LVSSIITQRSQCVAGRIFLVDTNAQSAATIPHQHAILEATIKNFRNRSIGPTELEIDAHTLIKKIPSAFTSNA